MKWNLPNMILIAGNGRNVGKTTFATNIIRHLSESTTVIGIKVSPHIHDLNEDLVIIRKTHDFVVAEERGHSMKDSSLLLQAGARKVYFIMAKQKDLGEAFSLITDQLEGDVVVAESGGLSELLTPGIFFFISSPKDQIIKKHYLKYKPIVVINGDSGFDFEPEWLSFSNKLFTLSPREK